MTKTDRCAAALSWRWNQMSVLHFAWRFLLTTSLRRPSMSMWITLFAVAQNLPSWGSIIPANSGKFLKLLSMSTHCTSKVLCRVIFIYITRKIEEWKVSPTIRGQCSMRYTPYKCTLSHTQPEEHITSVRHTEREVHSRHAELTQSACHTPCRLTLSGTVHGIARTIYFISCDRLWLHSRSLTCAYEATPLYANVEDTCRFVKNERRRYKLKCPCNRHGSSQPREPLP